MLDLNEIVIVVWGNSFLLDNGESEYFDEELDNGVEVG